MIGRSAETTRSPTRSLAARRSRLGRAIVPYLFVAPVVLALLALVAYPILRVIEVSFFRDYIISDNPTFIGLDNYTAIFADDDFWTGLTNSVLFTIGSVLLHQFLGFSIALLLNQRFNRRLRTVFRGVFILPWLFVPVIVSSIWKLILHPVGAVNSTLALVGIKPEVPIEWLVDAGLAMPTMIVANAWAGYAFSMLMLLAGLQSIPQDLYEAAAVDGANAWQRFLNVTVPSLAPTLVTVALLDSIWTFRLFDLPYLLTGGGPLNTTLVLPLLTYREAFEGFRFGQSSAVAVVILVVTLAFSILYLRFRARLIASS